MYLEHFLSFQIHLKNITSKSRGSNHQLDGKAVRITRWTSFLRLFRLLKTVVNNNRLQNPEQPQGQLSNNRCILLSPGLMGLLKYDESQCSIEMHIHGESIDTRYESPIYYMIIIVITTCFVLCDEKPSSHTAIRSISVCFLMEKLPFVLEYWIIGLHVRAEMGFKVSDQCVVWLLV